MYKYQEELLNEILKSLKMIEDMTDERYAVYLGEEQDPEAERMGYPTSIYAEINGREYFSMCDVWYTSSELTHKNVKFSKDIFLRFNKLIDQVLKDNKEREAFTEKLLNEMKAFNKALKDTREGKA